MDDLDWEHLRGLAEAVLSGGDDAWPPFWSALRPVLDMWIHLPSFLGRISQREDYCDDIILIAWEKLQHNDYSKIRAFFRRSGQSRTPEKPRAAHLSDPASRFRAWIRRVFKNIGIDYMRGLPEFVRGGRLASGSKRSQSDPANGNAQSRSEVYWQQVVTLHSGAAVIRDPLTVETTVSKMMEFLDTSIPKRQIDAVDMIKRGMSAAEIASELDLPDAKAADRVIARSRDRLKYRLALVLWSQGFSDSEIARRLDLDDARHAYRLVNAAKELLRRHFRPH